MPFGKSGVKKEDVMERCRVKLVGAIKTGAVFALYLGDVRIDHADFKTKLCKKVCLRMHSIFFVIYFVFGTMLFFCVHLISIRIHIFFSSLYSNYLLFAYTFTGCVSQGSFSMRRVKVTST